MRTIQVANAGKVPGVCGVHGIDNPYLLVPAMPEMELGRVSSRVRI